MLNSRTLTKQKDSVIAILNYLAKRRGRSANAISYWCGMSIQKAHCLCKVMAQYNLLYENEKVSIFSQKPYKIYTRNETLAKIFITNFTKPLDK